MVARDNLFLSELVILWHFVMRLFRCIQTRKVLFGVVAYFVLEVGLIKFRGKNT